MVDFRLKAGTFDRFRKLIVENARASLRGEAGCRQFDVVIPDGDADRVVLYEIYDDAAAFEAHKRTPHFAKEAERWSYGITSDMWRRSRRK